MKHRKNQYNLWTAVCFYFHIAPLATSAMYVLKLLFALLPFLMVIASAQFVDRAISVSRDGYGAALRSAFGIAFLMLIREVGSSLYAFLRTRQWSRDMANERMLFQYGNVVNEMFLKESREARKLERKARRWWFVGMNVGAYMAIGISVMVIFTLMIPVLQGKTSVGLFVSLVTAFMSMTQNITWQFPAMLKDIAAGRRMLGDFDTVLRMPEYTDEVGKTICAGKAEKPICSDKMRKSICIGKTEKSTYADKTKESTCIGKVKSTAYINEEENSVSVGEAKKHISNDDIRFESLEFCNVSFSYPGTEKEILKDLSFRMESGKHYAFAGRNGCGKSTIVKLILRLYEPDAGKILVNGRNIREYDVNQIWAMFAVLFQDYARYPLTVYENIVLGSRAAKTLEMSVSGSSLEEAWEGAASCSSLEEAWEGAASGSRSE